MYVCVRARMCVFTCLCVRACVCAFVRARAHHHCSVFHFGSRKMCVCVCVLVSTRQGGFVFPPWAIRGIDCCLGSYLFVGLVPFFCMAPCAGLHSFAHMWPRVSLLCLNRLATLVLWLADGVFSRVCVQASVFHDRLHVCFWWASWVKVFDVSGGRFEQVLYGPAGLSETTPLRACSCHLFLRNLLC
jgi:hypothetical protein